MVPPNLLSSPPADADALKARFKKRCADTNNVFQNWQIRVHRSISWLKRSAQFADDQPEAKFLFHWIALNSLYSRWNSEKNAPEADSYSRERFFRRLCEMDEPSIAAALLKHRGLANKLLSNPYLSEVFWRNPEDARAKGWATEDANYLGKNLKDHDYCRVLIQVMSRIFVLRGQLVHGASTGGSRLNRAPLNYSMQLLAILLPLVLQIVIDHGCNDDWPDLCYPPIG